MKQTLRTLTDRWIGSLHEFKNRPRIVIPDKDGTLNLINELIINVAASVARTPDAINRLGSAVSDEDKLTFIQQQYSGLFSQGGSIDNVTKIYLRMQADHASLLDLRRQEDWASFWDHARTLFFRAATTVMIAAVVLGTGYLAREWQIPLPMFRGLT